MPVTALIAAPLLMAAQMQSLGGELPAEPADYAEPPPQGEPYACVAAQVIVPPFNNTPAAMDQSRIAATAVMRESAQRGEKPVRVCQTSAVSPELSRIRHGNEVPIDPDAEADTVRPSESE